MKGSSISSRRMGRMAIVFAICLICCFCKDSLMHMQTTELIRSFFLLWAMHLFYLVNFPQGLKRKGLWVSWWISFPCPIAMSAGCLPLEVETWPCPPRGRFPGESGCPFFRPELWHHWLLLSALNIKQRNVLNTMSEYFSKYLCVCNPLTLMKNTIASSNFSST